jgi:hypothetical protein
MSLSAFDPKPTFIRNKKPRRSGVCVITALSGYAVAACSFFLRPTQPNSPKPIPSIA